MLSDSRKIVRSLCLLSFLWTEELLSHDFAEILICEHNIAVFHSYTLISLMLVFSWQSKQQTIR